jgi:hypothetical protein
LVLNLVYYHIQVFIPTIYLMNQFPLFWGVDFELIPCKNQKTHILFLVIS